MSDQPVLILVPAGEPYNRQPVRQFTHMVYFCPKLFLSWVALKVANGFLLLLLKQNTFLNIYTQKVGATVTHKIMYRGAQPSKNLGGHNLPLGSKIVV